MPAFAGMTRGERAGAVPAPMAQIQNSFCAAFKNGYRLFGIRFQASNAAIL